MKRLWGGFIDGVLARIERDEIAVVQSGCEFGLALFVNEAEARRCFEDVRPVAISYRGGRSGETDAETARWRARDDKVLEGWLAGRRASDVGRDLGLSALRVCQILERVTGTSWSDEAGRQRFMDMMGKQERADER